MTYLFEVIIETEAEDGKITADHQLITAPNMISLVKEMEVEFMDLGFEVVSVKRHGAIVRKITHNVKEINETRASGA